MSHKVRRVTEQEVEQWLAENAGIIGNRLRLEMKAFDIKNVDALINRIAIKRSTAYELYRGNSCPSLRTLGRLCLSFDITIFDLLGGD